MLKGHTQNMKRIEAGLAVAVMIGASFSGLYSAAAHSASNADMGKRLVAPDATTRRVGNGRVSGVVLLSPACPVAHIPVNPACAPKPYKTLLQVRSKVKGTVYRPVPTSVEGTFNLSLTPGSYLLQVARARNGSMFPRCPDLIVIVVGKKTLHVTMNCDSGIR